MHHKYHIMKLKFLAPLLACFFILFACVQNQKKYAIPTKKSQLIQVIKKVGFLKLPLSFEVLPDGLDVKYVIDPSGSDSLIKSLGIFRICGFLPDTSFYYSVIYNYPCSAYPCPQLMTINKEGNIISTEEIDAHPGCIDTPIESTTCYDSVWIDEDLKIRSISKVIGTIYDTSTKKDEYICNMRKLEGFIDKNGKIIVNQSDVIVCKD